MTAAELRAQLNTFEDDLTEVVLYSTNGVAAERVISAAATDVFVDENTGEMYFSPDDHDDPDHLVQIEVILIK